MPTWWRQRSLRARITILATTVFVVAFTVAIVFSYVALNNSLTRALDRSAVRTGQEVATLVNSGQLPDQLLAGSGGVFLVQVVDNEDRVLSFSAGADAAVSMLRPDELRRARAGDTITVPGARVGSDAPLRVVAVDAGSDAEPRTVLVAADVGRLQDSAELTREIGLYSIPVMGAVMALLTYLIVGYALRGVSALRRGADRITSTGRIDQRLPVPQAQDETYRLAVTLNAMLDRLESSTSKQRQFVGDAAHELRSPIASLRTQLEVAAMLGPATDWDEVVSDATIEVERLSRLVEDLLALARSDENSDLRRLESVDVRELADDIVAGYGHSPIPVRLAEGSETVTVAGDPDALRRVLVNLVDNAARHAASAVTVGTVRDGREAVVTVADDGPGIPADQRDAVFERFVRLDSARARDTGGTGLGLAIVREIVTAHGGRVTLGDNEPGLRVTVTLPAV